MKSVKQLRLLLSLGGILLCALFYSAQAGAWCKSTPLSTADQPAGKVITMSRGASPSAIQMPKDIPVGSEIYRITLKNTSYQYYRVNCNNNASKSNYYGLVRFIGAEPARSAWQGSSLGTVYETGAAGIGMVLIYNNTNSKKIDSKQYFFIGCRSGSCNTDTFNYDITYVLIKTGTISDGSLDFSGLPPVELLVGGDNSPGSDYVVFQPTLSGALSFTQATCALSEASKTVKLGAHKSSEFTTSSPASAWVDASINLINCNYGGAQNYQYNISRWSSSSSHIGTYVSPNTAKATWNLTLTPATSIIDDTNGIMAIGNDPGSATGIGIQLSSTNSATPKPVRFSQPTTGTMVSGSNATMTIPLYARYIKTESIVTAGRADGKVTYLIEYK